MRILLTNDDGINAPGLWRAAQALIPLSEVFICAPDRERSGSGSSISLQAPIIANTALGFPEEIRAFSVQGTPADCVILALERLSTGKFDLLVSGINAGANLGDDIFVSGTVGAALQGHFRGIPSIAISVTALDNVNFDSAVQLLSRLIDGDSEIFQNKRAMNPVKEEAPLISGKPLLLNINVPSLPIENIKGITITHLGSRSYADDVQEGKVGRWKWYWISRTKPQPEPTQGTDISAIRNHKISITPLSSDLTNLSLFPALEHAKIQLERDIQLSNSI